VLEGVTEGCSGTGVGHQGKGGFAHVLASNSTEALLRCGFRPGIDFEHDPESPDSGAIE
jgi:hypothetical protein